MYNETALKFAQDYKAKTGKSGVESYALEAYDSIGILAQAINEAGSTNGDAIVNALRRSPMTVFWEESISHMALKRTHQLMVKVMNGGISGRMLRSPWFSIKKRGNPQIR
jgi:hypothetical protein